jgi:hypothetical protein
MSLIATPARETNRIHTYIHQLYLKKHGASSVRLHKNNKKLLLFYLIAVWEWDRLLSRNVSKPVEGDWRGYSSERLREAIP